MGSRAASITLNREAASELCQSLIAFLLDSHSKEADLTLHYIPLKEPMTVGHGRGQGARIRPKTPGKGYQLTITSLG